LNLTSRVAQPCDAAAIAMIYNAGITDRIATFETELRLAEQVAHWFDGRHSIVVIEGSGGTVLAFAFVAGRRQGRQRVHRAEHCVASFTLGGRVIERGARCCCDATRAGMADEC
jgi:L-amino acid N-acyltransferase YncA